MQLFLKRRLSPIIKALKDSEKERLADCIEQNWQKTALEYSQELNTWQPDRPMEPELRLAFDRELERAGLKDIWRKDILDSIQRRRVLQTTPHLGATEGPRFFCINWLGSLGVPESEYYIVGMYSGIPFSNHTRPGRINRHKDSINLFPSTLQDGLVYRSKIPEKLVEIMDQTPRKLGKLFPRPVAGESYTKWALDACQHTERKILKKHNMVYLDINEVVAGYLVQVLRNPSHVMHKIFFNPKIREEFTATFPDEIFFYTPAQEGKYEKMESLTLQGDTLKSKGKEIRLDNPENLIREMEENRLCPGLITGFFVLAFLNRFKCFGSFAQVEYLPVYQKKLARLSFLKEFKIENVPASNLTTGFFPGGKNLYPVDILTQNKRFKPGENLLFGELLMGMKETLLGSYFTGSVRTRHAEKK